VATHSVSQPQSQIDTNAQTRCAVTNPGKNESRDHSGKKGNSRQVSGTSDASKTQSGLIRS
jgi:hypothetical protein